MKVIAFILGILILALTVQPCSDGNNIEDLHGSQLHENHNHNEDSDDTCSPFCVCACCSISITFETFVSYFVVTPRQLISTNINSLYTSNYLFDYLYFIWHPPKQIS